MLTTHSISHNLAAVTPDSITAAEGALAQNPEQGPADYYINRLHADSHHMLRLIGHCCR